MSASDGAISAPRRAELIRTGQQHGAAARAGTSLQTLSVPVAEKMDQREAALVIYFAAFDGAYPDAHTSTWSRLGWTHSGDTRGKRFQAARANHRLGHLHTARWAYNHGYQARRLPGTIGVPNLVSDHGSMPSTRFSTPGP